MIAIVVLEIFEFQHKNLTFGTKPDLCRLVDLYVVVDVVVNLTVAGPVYGMCVGYKFFRMAQKVIPF